MKVIWSAPARRDILRITASYRLIDPELSARMRERIEAAPFALLDHPRIASMTPRGHLKSRIKGTPLLLFFIVKHGRFAVRGVRHHREDWAGKF